MKPMKHTTLSRACLFVIPARLDSTRLPGKLLKVLDEQRGATVLQLTYESVLKSKYARKHNTYIATGDTLIRDAAEKFGAQVCFTSTFPRSGSERVEEAYNLLDGGSKHFDAVVNVQGDEPFIEPEHIDNTVNGLILNDWADAATCAALVAGNPPQDSSKVKVVTDRKASALYFSRQPIPHIGKHWLRHIGIYAFRPNIIQMLSVLPPSHLEQSEGLEQLRLLENGYKIFVASARKSGFGGIDTPEDFDNAVKHLQTMRKHV